jgi:hypothetical protein
MKWSEIMLSLVIKKQKTKPYPFILLVTFLFFMGIYTLIDSFNLSYDAMAVQYGSFLVIFNIILNVLMSLTSAFMFSLSSALFKLTGKEGKGSHMSFVSVVFGILTYGCTPCVIAFFATIGISFSVAILPLAGLPYKLISVLILSLGMVWFLRSIQKITCPIK